MPPSRHVEYVLLAEFDIDKGASLSHQYPEPTGTDEHYLSELMLPDGAHLRAEDWTIFFLNQRIPLEGSDSETLKEETAGKKPLLHVLNLVRTKHDTAARRGAMVKAMAICTRHRYLHVYKPVLLLAMENYFHNPSIAILEELYNAVNAMDLSQMPQFSWHEQQILRASDNKHMFEEKFTEIQDAQAKETLESGQQNGFPGQDVPGYERRNYIDLVSGQRKDALSLAGKDRHFFETKIVYDNIKLPIRVPLTLNPEEVGDFSLIKLVNTFTSPTSSVTSHSPHPHLDSYGPNTPPLLVLLNALLTQKRIIFLGHGHPSGEVANYVLAACAMGSGGGAVLRGFTERSFPYTSLLSVDDLLKCPGFIAGVTNPTFEDHPSWWDILCNIDTGKITVSRDITTLAQVVPGSGLLAPERNLDDLALARSASTLILNSPGRYDERSSSRDNRDNYDLEFLNEVIAAIQSHYSETSIRGKFEEYVTKLVALSAVYEEETYGATTIGVTPDNTPDPEGLLGTGCAFPDEHTRQRELHYFAARIEGWRSTISYKYYKKDFQIFLQQRKNRHFDVARQITRLRSAKELNDRQVTAIYQAFWTYIVDPAQIDEVLALLPHYRGGLAPFCFGLFHSSPIVRQYTLQFLNRLRNHPAGIRFIHALNRFQRLAYERLYSESMATTSKTTSAQKVYSNEPNFSTLRSNSSGRSS